MKEQIKALEVQTKVVTTFRINVISVNGSKQAVNQDTLEAAKRVYNKVYANDANWSLVDVNEVKTTILI